MNKSQSAFLKFLYPEFCCILYAAYIKAPYNYFYYSQYFRIYMYSVDDVLGVYM